MARLVLAPQDRPTILIVSNGQGEDWVGLQLALALQRQEQVNLLVLPLVGEGELYRQQGLVVLGGRWLPSGGFTFKHFPALWQDLWAGLLNHSWTLVNQALTLQHEVDLVLAVGDFLPLALAWRLGSPYIFIGCTKSDYYSPGRTCYLWPERWLMQQSLCRGIFTRDLDTAQHLVAVGVPACYLGNPMMDGLPEASPVLPWAIGLLPGSRPQEAQANFQLLLACARAYEGDHFMAALVSSLPLDSFVQPALAEGWHWQEPYLYTDTTKVWLRVGAFGEVLQQSGLFFAMAGTATEQAVGLGCPVISLPGPGPQFTRRFAQLQEQLLGESVLLCDTPRRAAQAAQAILNTPERLARIRANGLQRMGKPGAAEQITAFIGQVLTKVP